MDTKKLRQKILDLAIHGKLVPQDPNDEPASVLLERIRKEKEQLIKEGKIKSPKKSKSAGDTSHYPKEVPWELPKGWVWLSGEDIFLPMESTSPKGEFFEYIDIDAIDNATNCIKKPKHLAVVNAPSRATRKVSKGDVLFSMVRPYLRNIAMVELDSCIASTGFYVCRCSEILDSKYCYYLMLSNYVVEGLNQFMKGDNSPSINNTHITSWIYPIPPLSEQKRISGAIDGLLTYVGNLEGAMSGIVKCIDEVKSKLLDLAIHGKLVPQYPSDEPAIELLKRINPAFKPSDNLHYEGDLPRNWCITRLGDIIDFISGTSYQKADIVLNNNGIRILRGGNIQNGAIVLFENDIYVQSALTNSNNTLHKGDIVIVASTGSHELIGKAALARQEYPNTQIGAFMRIIRPKTDDLSDYLGIIFQSEYYKNHIRDVAKGTNINNIKSAYLTEFVISVPPLVEQKRITKKISELFSVFDDISNSIKELE